MKKIFAFITIIILFYNVTIICSMSTIWADKSPAELEEIVDTVFSQTPRLI